MYLKLLLQIEWLVKKIFEYLKGKGQTNVALISGNGGFGKSMRGQCKDVASDYGIKIVADETYGPKDTDMTSQLTKIKSMENVQAVVNPGFGQGPAIVTKKLQTIRNDSNFSTISWCCI